MFQLIVAVISIALIAVLAAASFYYGGTAFNQSSLKGQVTALVNAGQQVAGAQALYATDTGSKAGTLAALLYDGKYLASTPAKPAAASNGTWATNGSTASIAIDLTGTPLTNFCTEVAKQAGGANPVDANLPSTQQFGCVGTASAASFEFRV
ncbi:hypothetical protein [Bosea sp. RAC05]|uniref:hypothetical protein n=1 Tax=Bosea sp. RAC05 TaxID=1842539 RepID=UPI00083E095B|nr:hypothetical protein [Bosea sp. RAC05]AOG03281.1 hypothetical protein BSY19_4929 [Bosea sp. RAC05]